MRPRLLFVSPVFLFPAVTGGRIRTSQILRGLKGGRFQIALCSPVPEGADHAHAADLASVCDRFSGWPAPVRGPLFRFTRMRHVLSRLPIPVATDRTAAGSAVVRRELAGQPDVVVFDFLHSAVLAPGRIGVPSVLFTHNVEAEIFRRHAEVSGNPLLRALWRGQLRKMEEFERAAAARFDTVVAVSDRDARHFGDECGARRTAVIPTGVDLDFFSYAPPGDSGRVVFTGSMDWLPNIDGIELMLDEIWPLVARGHPAATMTVIGRDPPAALVRRAPEGSWRFTGFVDDVRPHVRGASACVIPLRVGGGTRIKAYEAMAQGTPVVSTALGVEGLPLEPGRHYLLADSPGDFAEALLRLLREPDLRERISREARAYVESRFSSARAASVFEQICLDTLRGAQPAVGTSADAR